MVQIDEITVNELQQELDSVEKKTPTLRLIAAIAYLNGVTRSELAEWFGGQRKTIYSWLKRLDEGNLPNAIRDDNRPGRPRKLSDQQ